MRVCLRSLSQMQKGEMDSASQFGARHSQGVPDLFTAEKLSYVALQSDGYGPTAMPESEISYVEELWGTGNSVQICQRPRSLFVDQREFRGNGGASEIGIGSHRQRETLRTGQSSLVYPTPEYCTYNPNSGNSEGASIPSALSRRGLFDWDSFGFFGEKENDSRTSCMALGECSKERAKVYDIVNAGPLHRFTVQGLLVANCIIDYPDLMAYDPKYKRESLGKIYEQLRGMAVERNMAVCAYSQSNRLGMAAKLIDMGKVAEDFSKTMTADTIITYNQTDAEYKLGLARLFVAKAREDEKHFQVLISQSYAMAQFAIDSVRMVDSVYWPLVEGDEDKED